MTRRIVVTGPLNSLAEYADAARAQGWEPILFPLLEIRHRIVHLTLELDRAPDWLCVTSANALRSIEENKDNLLEVPCATVGWISSRHLQKLGFRVPLDGLASAAALADALLALPAPPRLVLWPRGSMSDELGRLLAARGVEVCQPIVYETSERADTGPFPAAEAIFFASPSAVRAHSRRVARGEPAAAVAIALGPTTLRALQSAETHFFPRVLALDHPLPAELGQILVGLELER
ncbi:MAG: uroporphyrinogen-III synthase [Planctomycetota bacterium]